MFVQLRDSSERPVDIVQSWVQWFAEAVTLCSILPLGGLFVVAGWKFGWAQLPMFVLVLLTFVFLCGQFGWAYIQARVAYIWHRLHQPPPAPAAVSRRYFWMTAVVAVVLIMVSMAASRWIGGVGWDSVPIADRWSPWTIPCAAVGALVIAEINVALRVRREILHRCRDIDDELMSANHETQELA